MGRPEQRVRKWFHAPWMTFNPNGREPIRGLTNEREPQARARAQQETPARNWAVGIYNPPGGYALGQVWRKPRRPTTAKVAFPVGTVTAKLLFTEANPVEVPFSIARRALVERRGHGPRPRRDRHVAVLAQVATPDEMRLLQLDIAVRDERSHRHRWVFGTFYFEAAQPGTKWHEKLVPAGDVGQRSRAHLRAVPVRQAPEEGWLNPAVQAKFKEAASAGRWASEAA